MTELAIAVQNLSKCYRVFNNPKDRLLQSLWGRHRTLYREFWALKDVSFELPRGQTLGIVGRNGSGKSTLLQIICSTLTPTSGTVAVHGRVGALLELGSGFNPEFTGLENVFLNAALLGLSQRDTEERLDAILGFADIGAFIDQPVKTYSSGMALRLAFAVQANVDPEILVVDEALAVGDEPFQKKCYARLAALKQQGSSILLVTHSCPQIVQHCDIALHLHQGQLQMQGKPKTVTAQYQRMASTGDTTTAQSSAVNYPEDGARIDVVQVLDGSGKTAELINYGQSFILRFHYTLLQEAHDLQLACNLANRTGIRISGQLYPAPASGQTLQGAAGDRFSIDFYFRGGLLPGMYFVSGGLWEKANPGRYLHRVVDAAAFRVHASTTPSSFGLCDLAAAQLPQLKQLS